MSAFPMKILFSISLAVMMGFILFANDAPRRLAEGSLVSSAQAVIGRPFTPLSYAGVARRTTRRAVVAGTAVGAAARPVVVAPGCVQAVNAYGQVYWRCP